MIEIEKLDVVFGSFKALSQVSVTIPEKAGVTALIGPNGAGKTTLIRTIFDQEKKAAGSVRKSSSDLAYCTDTPSFEPFLRPDEVLQQSLALYGRSVEPVQIKELLTFVGLEKAAGRYVGSFSRGMKQRLGLAAVLILEPQILFLDEPTSALDPFGREAMLALIRKIGQERRVVVSSHLLADMQQIADSLLVLDKGHLLYQGELSDFLENHQGGLSSFRVADKTSALELLDFLTVKGISPKLSQEDEALILVPRDQFIQTFQVLGERASLLLSCRKRLLDLPQAFTACVREFEREDFE